MGPSELARSPVAFQLEPREWHGHKVACETWCELEIAPVVTELKSSEHVNDEVNLRSMHLSAGGGMLVVLEERGRAEILDAVLLDVASSSGHSSVARSRKLFLPSFGTVGSEGPSPIGRRLPSG
jgi:hypothetical protein